MKMSAIIGISLVLAAMPLAVVNVMAHTCVGPVGACGIPCPADGRFHDHTEVDHTTVPPTVLQDSCAPALGATNPCPDQPVHRYGSGGSAGGRSATVTGGDDFGVGFVTVTDTNADDCNGSGPGAWDGDYDFGVGGGAFGYGPWALDPDCNYLLNVHGPNVAVNDAVFGSAVGFVVGEDDQSGPVKVPVDADGDGTPEGVACETDGNISPGDPATDPTADADDCLSNHFVGTGATCGSGGGDGLYWVFLDGAFVDENTGGVTTSNPPTSGTITAF